MVLAAQDKTRERETCLLTQENNPMKEPSLSSVTDHLKEGRARKRLEEEAERVKEGKKEEEKIKRKKENT